MLHDRGLDRLTDAGSVARGIDYARRGRARIISSPLTPGSVSGLVRGSGGVLYETDVTYTLDSTGTVSQFDGRCSCPVGDDCKHAVALLITALTALNGTRLPTAVAPAAERLRAVPARPAWELMLDNLVGTDAAAATTSGTESLGLAFELTQPVLIPEPARPSRLKSWSSPARSTAPGGRLSVRPVCRGSQGKWIRTGVSWSDLTHGYGRWKFREDQVRVLAGIGRLSDGEARWSSSGNEPWIQLQSLHSPAVWELLAEATALDVALIMLDAGQPAVTIAATQAEVTIDVRREDGGLLVRPAIALNGAPVPAAHSLLIGDPAHGVATWSVDSRGRATGLLLARLNHRVDQAMRAVWAANGVRVPATEESRFVADYVPALRRHHQLRSVDQTFTLPVEHPPVLSVTVQAASDHQSGDQPDHRLELAWEWIYRVDDDERRLPIDPAPASPRHRDPVQEKQILNDVGTLLVEVPRLFPATNGLSPSVTTSARESIDLVTSILPRLLEHPSVQVEIVGTLPDFRQIAEPVITLTSTTVEGSRDWFDLTVTIDIGAAAPIPFEEVFLALATGEDLMILPDGSYLWLDRPEFHQLRQLIEEARGLQDRPDGPLRISRFQAGLWNDLERLGIVDTQSTEWLVRINSWQSTAEQAAVEPPGGLLAELRPYQLDGYRWLNLLRDNGLGGILADDMGLGKTIQTLAMISRARELAPAGDPFLVVAPTSVVGNWQAEAARFTPTLKSAAITETEARRGVPLAEVAAGADLVITSYTLFRLEFESYQQLSFDALILDEAQLAKNHQSKAFSCAKRLAAPVKFAITGTPMENNLMELWALFSIVAPGLFPHPGLFNEEYRVPIERNLDPERLARLRRRIGPLMLRRTKEQVAADLPEKQEQVLELDLEPGHRKVYQRHLQRERQKVLGLLGDLDRNRFAIFRSLTLLRQASIDPFLVDPANAKIGSTKLNVLMELLADVVAEGHRTLIFSQFTSFLGRVRERLDEDGISYCYLDGSTRDRSKVLAQFRDGTAPVFLISLKAGGVGLNLTEADYCILLDPWWNPATEAQAVDRTHRIGQTKPVMVYRLVSKDTIEEKVMAMKESKSKLFAGVMSAEDGTLADTASTGKAITAADIRELLT